MALLDITSDEQGEAARLALTGELDIASAPELESRLSAVEAGGVKTVVVDLRGLDFMDSTGLRVLVAADARAREASRRLVLVRGGQTIQKVFRVTGLDERLDMVDDAGPLGFS